jgi:hypothetical protein
MQLREIIKTSIHKYLNEQMFLSNVILEATADEIKTKYYPNINYDIFNQIINSDKVTSNLKKGKVGKYAKWLLKLYSNDELNLIDLDIVEKYLPIFDKLLKANKLEKNNINHYNSLEDMHSVVSDYLDNNKNISKGDEIKRIKKSVKKIYEDNRFIVIEPLTKESSCHYGKSTKWCTSQYTSDKFETYTSRGPLYVIMDKSKRNYVGDYVKYLIHFQDGEYKDDSNKNVSFKQNPEIKEIIKKLIKLLKISDFVLVNFRINNIQFIDNPSEDIQLKAVTTDPFTIRHINNPTEAVQLIAVKNDGMLIEHINNPSEQVKKAAINQNPNAKNVINLTYEEKINLNIKHFNQLLSQGYITQEEYNDLIKDL